MNEHDLPDERPLDESTRARMRAELIAATAQPEPRRTSWVAPVAASVAMLVVVGTTGALLAFGGGDKPGGAEVGPAANSADNMPPDEQTSAGAGSEQATTSSPEPGAERGESTAADPRSPLPPVTAEDPSTCAADVRSHLGEAREVAAIDYDGGRASLWYAGPVWVVCDTWAAEADGGSTTLIGARKVDSPVDKSTFQISENHSNNSSQFFAAGPAIPGVAAIVYTFPDGHVAEAEMTDQMWLMTYLPTEGPLASGRAPSKPVTVKVTHDGGQVDDYTLEWGLDTCAQVNHGC